MYIKILRIVARKCTSSTFENVSSSSLGLDTRKEQSLITSLYRRSSQRMMSTVVTLNIIKFLLKVLSYFIIIRCQNHANITMKYYLLITAFSIVNRQKNQLPYNFIQRCALQCSTYYFRQALPLNYQIRCRGRR